MSRSLAKKLGVGQRIHRRRQSCGRNCWICHGEMLKARKKVRQQGKKLTREQDTQN